MPPRSRRASKRSYVAVDVAAEEEQFRRDNAAAAANSGRLRSGTPIMRVPSVPAGPLITNVVAAETPKAKKPTLASVTRDMKALIAENERLQTTIRNGGLDRHEQVDSSNDLATRLAEAESEVEYIRRTQSVTIATSHLQLGQTTFNPSSSTGINSVINNAFPPSSQPATTTSPLIPPPPAATTAGANLGHTFSAFETLFADAKKDTLGGSGMIKGVAGVLSREGEPRRQSGMLAAYLSAVHKCGTAFTFEECKQTMSSWAAVSVHAFAPLDAVLSLSDLDRVREGVCRPVNPVAYPDRRLVIGADPARFAKTLIHIVTTIEKIYLLHPEILSAWFAAAERLANWVATASWGQLMGPGQPGQRTALLIEQAGAVFLSKCCDSVIWQVAACEARSIADVVAMLDKLPDLCGPGSALAMAKLEGDTAIAIQHLKIKPVELDPSNLTSVKPTKAATKATKKALKAAGGTTMAPAITTGGAPKAFCFDFMTEGRVCSRGAACIFTHPSVPVPVTQQTLIKGQFLKRPNLKPKVSVVRLASCFVHVLLSG